MISNYKITPPQVHPVITNNTIVKNYAIEAGGGIVVVGSERLVTYDPVAPLISGNNIYRNVSAFHGGGIGIYGHAAPQITNNYHFLQHGRVRRGQLYGQWGRHIRDLTGCDRRAPAVHRVRPRDCQQCNRRQRGQLRRRNSPLGHRCGSRGYPVVTNNTVVGNNGTGISWITTYPIIQNNLIASTPGDWSRAIPSLPPRLCGIIAYMEMNYGRKTPTTTGLRTRPASTAISLPIRKWRTIKSEISTCKRVPHASMPATPRPLGMGGRTSTGRTPDYRKRGRYRSR